MRQMTRREWLRGSLRLSAAAALAPTLASCGRSRTGEQRDKSSVTILYEGGPETDLGYNNEPAKFLVFMPFVAWNTRGELEGRLAERWEHSPDFRTWTIRLRDGIRWHDGMSVTAQDVKFTFDLLQHPDTNKFVPGGYTVTVLDDRTYTISYRRQEVSNEGGALDDYIVCWPKHLLEHLDPKQIDTWDFWSHPVGCGPYRHVRTVPQTMMKFEANPNYFRGRPKIESVILKFTGWNAGSAMPELLSGDVDAAVSWYRPDVASAGRNRGFRVYQKPWVNCIALWWNVRHPLFEDHAVRLALTLAINRRELSELSNLPAEMPLVDCLFTQRQLLRGDLPEPLAYDPQLAGRLLDDAGWLRRSGDGLRERNGKPFRFTLLVQAGESRDDAAVFLQDQFKRIGVRMEIRTTSWPWPNVQSGDFEAAQADFGPWWLAGLRGSGYQNPAFFQLLDTTRTTFDPDEKDRLYHKLTRTFQADVPVTVLFPLTFTTIASTRIRGLDNSPYRGDLTWCMDQLWLEDEA